MAHSILGNPWEQPYCAWLEKLLSLDKNTEAIQRSMPEDRPAFEETWANPAPDAVRLRRQNRQLEAERIGGQQDKEQRIYDVFALRARARDIAAEQRRAE